MHEWERLFANTYIRVLVSRSRILSFAGALARLLLGALLGGGLLGDGLGDGLGTGLVAGLYSRDTVRTTHLDVGEGVPQHRAMEVDASSVVHPVESAIGARIDGEAEVVQRADAHRVCLLCVRV